MKKHIIFTLVLLGVLIKLIAVIPLSLATCIDEGYNAMCYELMWVWGETKVTVKDLHKSLFE